MKRHLLALGLSLNLFACHQESSSQVLSESSKASLGLNDLAILMPIHTVRGLLDTLPRLSEGYVYDWTDAERGKRLLPNGFNGENEDQSKDFILTSLRIDPCANLLQIETKKTNDECVRELRLVWQRLDKSQNGSWIAGDSNTHTLYTLSTSEFEDVIGTLKKLHANASVDTTPMPLLPHPVIEKEGVNSPYLKGVLELVQRYAKPEALSEVASMRGQNTITWSMSHLAVKDGAAHDFAIPATKDHRGMLSNQLVVTLDFNFNGDFSTFGPEHNFILPSMPTSGGRGGFVAPEKRKSIAEAKLKNAPAIENPRMHNPRNMDCFSCHVASKQKEWHDFADQEFEGFPALETFSAHEYRSQKWNLEARYPIATASLQVFSFGGAVHGFTPVIAPRVINDTAASLDYLRAMGL